MIPLMAGSVLTFGRTPSWGVVTGTPLSVDERVVDALGLQPGEQEVAERVRADRGGDAWHAGEILAELAAG
jgi:hypothetical protein